jgi:nucleoside-diphosphate-sugar epimerase
MSSPRVFVTGAAGFVGRAVVCELLARGAIVRCLVRAPDRAASLLDEAMAAGLVQPGALEIVLGALGAGAVDPRWLAGCNVVLHAAGALRGPASVLVRENVVATRRLIGALAVCAIRRFVLVSSISVYASPPLATGETVDETCSIEPHPERRSAYVYSKVVQEAVCRDAAAPLVVIRPGIVYGPGRNRLSDRVGPRLGRYLALVAPDRRMPCTFVANCASALAAAALTSGVDGAVFNVVDDELPTARQLVDAYRASGGDLRTLHVPRRAITFLSKAYERWYSRSRGDLPVSFLPYVIDPLYKDVRFSNAAAHERLHWRPNVDLRAALRATATGNAINQGTPVAAVGPTGAGPVWPEYRESLGLGPGSV